MLIKIYKLSYSYIKELKEVENISSKLYLAKKYRSETNSLILNYLGKNNNNELIQFSKLYFLIQLLRQHALKRGKIIRYCRLNKILFLILSISLSFLFSIKYFLYSIYVGSKNYKFTDFVSSKEIKIICPINFAEHNFENLINSPDSNLSCANINLSLGEYILKNYNNHHVLSINEFVRHSRHSGFIGSKSNQVPRKKAHCNFYILLLIINCITILKDILVILKGGVGQDFLGEFVGATFRMQALPIISLESKNLPSIYLFKSYDWSIWLILLTAGIPSERMQCISYSSNIFDALDYQLNYPDGLNCDSKDPADLIAKVPLSTLFFKPEICIGYNYHQDFINNSRKILDKKYGLKLASLNGVPNVSVPIQLGYEEDFRPEQGYDIVIFDVPPMSVDEQISAGIVGFPSSCEEYYRCFLEQIIQAADKLDLRVLLKTKYSMDNYSQDHRNYITSLVESGALDREVSPYASLYSVIKNAKVSISFPITGSYQFARAMGAISLVYFPEISDIRLDRVYGDGDYVYGFDCLHGRLEKIFAR